MNGGSRVALVTGTGFGFGWHTALRLARDGKRVFAGLRESKGRRADRAAELRRIAHDEELALEVVELEVNDEASIARALETVQSQAGRLDILVNNAGFGVIGPFETISMEAAKRQFETNVWGVWRMCRVVAPLMREQGEGYIVNVSSDAAIRSIFVEAAYAASKFAVEGLSEVLRWELQQFGIRVCIVRPGWYESNFEASMESTIDWDNPEGPYGPLVRDFSAGMAKKESGKPETHEVADRIAELVEMEDPPLRSEIGCAPLRARGLSDEEYERELFRFYEVEQYRGPWARAGDAAAR